MSEGYHAVPPPDSLSKGESKNTDASFLDAIAKARAIAAKAKEAHGMPNEDVDSRKRTLSNDEGKKAEGSSRNYDYGYERDSKRQYSNNEGYNNKYGLGSSDQQSRSSYMKSAYGPGISEDKITQDFEIPINTLKIIIKYKLEYLKHIQDISGATLNLREENTDGERYGKGDLSGSKEQVRKGKEMIDKLVVSSQSPDFDMKKFIDLNTPTSSILQTLGVPSNIRREQVSVPNNKVGLVIGRGGETIRELMEFSGARMNVVMEQTSEQILKNEKFINIQGTEECIRKAREFITQILNGEYTSPRGGNNQNLNGFEKSSIQVPTDKVGLVIGRGGETIKGLMQQTRTKIFIEMPDVTPTPPTRTINISGTQSNIEYAKNLINEKINVGAAPYNNSRYVNPMYANSGYNSGYGGGSYGQYPGYSYQGAESAYQGEAGYQYPGYENSEYKYPGTGAEGGNYGAQGGNNEGEEDPNAAASNPAYQAPDPNDPEAVAAYEAYVKQYNDYYAAYYASMGYSYPQGGEGSAYAYPTAEGEATSAAYGQSNIEESASNAYAYGSEYYGTDPNAKSAPSGQQYDYSGHYDGSYSYGYPAENETNGEEKEESNAAKKEEDQGKDEEDK
ncbi:hypothetical protein K502DRAFT_340192 [Neoconidiobolus thromboides FSU 785]|nr:hypothetical protein K502DRAFT_340192 [Neoconidiobolus thromboides FSU 785]